MQKKGYQCLFCLLCCLCINVKKVQSNLTYNSHYGRALKCIAINFDLRHMVIKVDRTSKHIVIILAELLTQFYQFWHSRLNIAINFWQSRPHIFINFDSASETLFSVQKSFWSIFINLCRAFDTLLLISTEIIIY